MRSRRPKTAVWRAFAATVAILAALPAWARLGGDVASVEADQAQLQGTRRMMAKDSYTVHEIQAASGTVVREYVSGDGKVFAVAFKGPFLPDMGQLLGDYFAEYAAVRKAQVTQDPSLRRARRPVVVQDAGLNVQISGHPRAFAGTAYVPGMLPNGLRPEDIQ